MLASLDVVAVEGRAGDQELAELLGVWATAPTRLHTTSGSTERFGTDLALED